MRYQEKKRAAYIYLHYSLNINEFERNGLPFLKHCPYSANDDKLTICVNHPVIRDDNEC